MLRFNPKGEKEKEKPQTEMTSAEEVKVLEEECAKLINARLEKEHSPEDSNDNEIDSKCGRLPGGKPFLSEPMDLSGGQSKEESEATVKFHLNDLIDKTMCYEEEDRCHGEECREKCPTHKVERRFAQLPKHLIFCLNRVFVDNQTKNVKVLKSDARVQVPEVIDLEKHCKVSLIQSL